MCPCSCHADVYYLVFIEFDKFATPTVWSASSITKARCPLRHVHDPRDEGSHVGVEVGVHDRSRPASFVVVVRVRDESREAPSVVPLVVSFAEQTIARVVDAGAAVQPVGTQLGSATFHR